LDLRHETFLSRRLRLPLATIRGHFTEPLERPGKRISRRGLRHDHDGHQGHGASTFNCGEPKTNSEKSDRAAPISQT
jgi:hypothetical protein